MDRPARRVATRQRSRPAGRRTDSGAFDADYDAVLMVTARRDRLNQQIQQMAGDSAFTPVVRTLG